MIEDNFLTTAELFCGTKSFSKVAKQLGHEVLTYDSYPGMDPDVCMDILSVSNIPSVDVLWASPPCTCFSVASIGKHWGGGYRAYKPKTQAAKTSLLIMEKTIQLIIDSNPTIWFIENPRGVLRKLPVMDKLPAHFRHTITYCQYGDNRMKPTDIWTNCYEWKPRPMCKNGDKCHEAAPRGSKTGTQGIKGAKDRGVIPPALFHEIFESIK